MHVLVIPSWYPNSYNNLTGIFFKEQSEALIIDKRIDKVGIIAVTEIGIKNIIKQKKLDFGFVKEENSNIVTYQYQLPNILRNKKINDEIKLFFFKKQFYQYIRKYRRPDIVHLHSFYHYPLVKWIKEKFNIPYIITEHTTAFARNLLNSYEEKKAFDAFNNSSKNLAVSKELGKLLGDKFNKKFEFLPNFIKSIQVNEKKFDKFTFINVGFLDEKKNQKMLIDAFVKNYKNVNDKQLIIVGDGPLYNDLKNYLNKNNIKNVIIFGRASREDIFKLMKKSHVYVHSSKYETFGVVLIEALSQGLPVVSTKCGGPESIVTDKKVGYLCEIDLDDLSHKIKKVFENYNFFDEKYIQKFFKQNFSQESVIDKLINIYEEVINEN